jgi:hypothetical protein
MTDEQTTPAQPGGVPPQPSSRHTLTKSDGSKVTVKFDKDFNVTSIEDGMGAMKGQPNGHR